MRDDTKCGVHLLLLVGLVFIVGPTLRAAECVVTQTDDASAHLAFEVATVKPIDTNGAIYATGLTVYPGGRVVIPTASLKNLVTTAFGLSFWQVTGGDAWVDNEQYEVVARASDSLRPRIKTLRHTLFGIEDETLRAMLQALLIERFQLKFHRETRIGDVYLLERGDKPLVLSRAEDRPGSANASENSGGFGSIGRAGGRWTLANTSMAQLAKFASDYVLHTPVLDRTDVSGLFDYRQPPNRIDSEANDTDHNVSFMRLVSQLGLKLEKTKGPVEIFVIDSASRPSAN